MKMDNKPPQITTPSQETPDDLVEGKQRVFQKWHYRAVELRYEGKTYEEIVEGIKQEFGKQFHIASIRKWFSRGELLHNEYIDYAKKENERRRQLVLEELKKIAPLIPTKIQELLTSRYLVAWGKKVVDPETGKPMPMLDSTTVKTLALLAEMLGFKVESNDVAGDPLDEYFDRNDAELEKQYAREIAPPVPLDNKEVAQENALPVPAENSGGDSTGGSVSEGGGNAGNTDPAPSTVGENNSNS
jgi:hypothetical protein